MGFSLCMMVVFYHWWVVVASNVVACTDFESEKCVVMRVMRRYTTRTRRRRQVDWLSEEPFASTFANLFSKSTDVSTLHGCCLPTRYRTISFISIDLSGYLIRRATTIDCECLVLFVLSYYSSQNFEVC